MGCWYRDRAGAQSKAPTPSGDQSTESELSELRSEGQVNASPSKVDVGVWDAFQPEVTA